MNETSSEYIIVTPTKNESKNLEKLVGFIASQTIKPKLWVIADESDDDTLYIVNDAAETYEWIKALFLDKRDGYLGKGYAYACKAAFDFSIEYCKQHNINYNYIGLVDADVVMDANHFEKLISKMEKDPKLGIASGIEYWQLPDKLARNPQREVLPIGPARLWRAECFHETGGYGVSEAPPDTISNIKANLKGWDTKQFEDIQVLTRQMSTARGHWKGFLQNGKYAYVMHTPLFIVAMKTIKYSFTRPYYIGLAYSWGYVIGVIHKVERINDSEVVTYMKQERPKEIVKNYVNKLLRRKNEIL